MKELFLFIIIGIVMVWITLGIIFILIKLIDFVTKIFNKITNEKNKGYVIVTIIGIFVGLVMYISSLLQ